MQEKANDHTTSRRQYLAALGAGSIGLFAGCSGGDSTSTGDDTSNNGQPDSIVIGSDIPYPPFEYRNQSGELVGFDVDIAEAVFTEQLGIEYEFQKTSFASIIASLNNANFRVIMSAMTITEDRAERVDFSDPYYTAYQTVAMLEGSDISSREDLRGLDVGVQRGTTGQEAAAELQEQFDGDLTINQFDQINGAFDALLNNQVDVVINDNTVNAQFVADNDGVVFLEGEGEAAEQGGNAPDYLTLTVEEYGIAFRQDDDEFRQQVNDALATIREDGTYEEIYNEHFDA